MRNDPRHRTETLFQAALGRPAGAERAAFLDGACGDEPELRARIDVLLAAHDEAGDFLEGPAVRGSHEGPGSSIGPYKLLQEIGEGGMGVVYMAEQERPVRRKVALKVIKLGMDTKQVIARFEAERQALALMDHAHIARVLDAGATETGRPYFVMELVRGVPIHEYCDTQKLPTEQRLKLFVDVCRAVQHAHQKGIIHRDLKPTNVLVTSHDGVPVPKIIDFGVAKATNQKLTERTLFTEFHQVIGTPEYMSPEQAEMSGLDVDTRSDIYALGVLLYQLLTGTTPVDPTALRTAGYEEMTRMIREDEPPAPSTRISKLGAGAVTIASNRGSNAGALSRYFRGELDWIVMKALEKDRTRRYDTASAFATDVVRHLENHPVEAGPPGATYRLAKFARRNKKAVAAALVLLTVVGLGLAGTTAGFLRARAEADRSGRISASLQDVLAVTGSAHGAEAGSIEDVLATVREVFGEEHATYAAVLDTLSERLNGAGDFEAAEELSREALEVWSRIYGERHPNVALALARLGKALRAQGEDEQAEVALRSALDILAPAPTAATALTGPAGLAAPAAYGAPGLAGYDARVELADLLGNRGEYAEADVLLEESLAILRASPSPARFRILQTLEHRAVLQLNQPAADARDTMREVYEETHGFYPDDSPLLAIAAMGYGRQLYQHGEQEAAEPYLREAVRRFRACPTPSPVYLLGSCDLLFQIVRQRTDEESVRETDDLLRDTIAAGRSILGVDALVSNQKYYANRLLERERFADALEAMLDAHAVLVEANRPVDEREEQRDSLTGMAFYVAIRPGLPTKAYARAREAAEIALEDEPDHPAMTVVLGIGLVRLGEYALAAEVLDRPARPLSEARGGLARLVAPADHAFRALAHARLGDDARARTELAQLRTALAGVDAETLAGGVLREVEALLEPASAAAAVPPPDASTPRDRREP